MVNNAEQEVPVEGKIVIGVLAVVILLENILVCYIVYSHRYLRTFTNKFIVSMALSDVLFAAVMVPTSFLAPNEAVVNGYIVAIILLGNVGNLFAVTLDRFLAVLRPLVYSYTMTKHFLKILIAAWVIPIVYAFLPLLWGSEFGSRTHSVYLFCMVLIMIVIPYVLILLAYIRIFGEVTRLTKNLAKLHGSQTAEYAAASKEGKRVSGEARVARVFAIIAGIFLLTWMPVIYMTGALALKRFDAIPQSLPAISWFTLTLGSLLNAPVYAFLKADFRKAFLKTFHIKTKRDNNNMNLSNSSPAGRAISSYTMVPN